jgi:hypothetical protein
MSSSAGRNGTLSAHDQSVINTEVLTNRLVPTQQQMEQALLLSMMMSSWQEKLHTQQ